MLEVSNLQVTLGDLTLADRLSMTFHQGKINVIIGPNGTGKSTLLKTLFGDISSQGGEIVFNGRGIAEQSVGSWRSQFGYMPQDIHLDLELSVLEVVLLGRLDSLSLRLDDAMITAALTALDDIGLLHLAERSVNTLSGGQCQMVLFAQALMRRPQILMLDEPVSALDLYYQQVLLEHLKRQTRDHHWVSVMVVHDLNLAAQYADNLLVLKQGRLVAQGTPAAVLTPELIAEVYQVDADVVLDQNGVPFVRTHGIRGEQRTSATLAENVLRVA